VAAHGVRVAGSFRLSPEAQERAQLLNAYSWLDSDFAVYETPAINALRRIKQHALGTAPPGSRLLDSLFRAARAPHEIAMFAFVRQFHPSWLAKTCRLQIIVEPAPNPDSRIVLSPERDALGLNRVEVSWRLGELEQRTFNENFRLVSAALQSAGLTLTESPVPFARGEWPAELEGTWHHMGTTRMHDSPRSGVVDCNCRVHELANLYVAGSSVFPTVGASFPTINLVALAARLANHVAHELSALADLSGAPGEGGT
jgi:choline dehydrogenase-like flavoprotein